MTLHGRVFFIGALAVIAPLSAIAEDRPVVAVDFDGCAPIVDTGKVFSELALDLGADQVQPTTVLPLDATTPADAMRVRLRCTEKSFEVVVRIDARNAESLWLSDTSGSIRARTLALAIAERIRQIRLEPPPPPPPPPAAETATHVTESVRVRTGAVRDPEKMKIEGEIALSLAGLTLAGFAVGSPLAAIGDAQSNRGDLRGAGAVVLGVSCAPLIGAAVAFGMWMHERSLPPP
jgi:hypothetical protein